MATNTNPPASRAREELLPCPFCGSTNIDAEGWASTDSAGPACDDCGASAGGVSKSLQENIAEWNRRARTAHVADRRERIATAFMAAQIQWIGVDTAIAGSDAVFEAVDQFIAELDREGEEG